MKSPLIVIQNDEKPEILEGFLGPEIELKLSQKTQNTTHSLGTKSSFLNKNLSWLDFKKFKKMCATGLHSNSSSMTSINSFNSQVNRKLDEGVRTTFYSRVNQILQFNSILSKSKDYWSLEFNSNSCFWLDIQGKCGKELAFLSSILNLSKLTLNCLEDQLPINDHWHQYDNYFYFGLAIPSRNFQANTTNKQQKHHHKFGEAYSNYLHVLITRSGVITISTATLTTASNRLKVFKRILGLSPQLEITPDLIIYSVLDFIIDEIILLTNDLELSIDNLDDDVFIKRSHKILQKFEVILNSDALKELESNQFKLIQLSQLISGKQDLIRTLNRRYLMRPELKLYLGDLNDHILTILTNLHFLEKTLNRIQNTITASKSYESLKSNCKSLKPTLRLMYFGCIFSISSVVSTVWGMRCYVPSQRSVHTKDLFPYSGFLFIEFGSVLLGCFLTWLANWYLIKFNV